MSMSAWMHGCFGRAAASGSVKHECWILRRSISCNEFFAGCGNPSAPLCARHSVQIDFILAGDDDRNLRAHTGGRQKLRKRFRMDNCYARLAILKVMNVIGRARERIHGDGDRADFYGAKKSGYKL